MAKSVLQGGGSLAAKLALAKDEKRNRNSGNTRSSKPDVSVTYSDPLLGKKASTKNSNNEGQDFSAFENNSGNRLSSIKTETYTPRYSNTSNTIDSVSEDDFKSQTTGTTDITQEVTQEPYDGMAGRIGMDQPQVGSEEWVRQKSQEEADRLVQEELQQISRAGQLFDRQVENQQISTDRSVEDIQRDADRVKQDRDFQLEEYRTNAMRQMADTKQQRDQTLQAIRKQGAAMGLNMTSTFYDNYENTMQKFNNVINRVKEDLNTVEGRSQLENQRLDEDVNRMTKRLLEDHEMNIGRLNEDFRFATRNLQNDMIVDANALVEKYGLSSDKLGARIQELGLQAFNAVNQAYSSYLSNVDTQTDILDKQVNSVLDTRDKFLKQEKEYAQSFLDSSMNRNKNDLESLVLQGFISEREAQNVLGEMIQSTIDTLDTISTTGVGIQFQDEIVNGLNEGKTPNQIMTEIYNTPEFQQAIETASQTDPFFDLKRQQMQQGLESGELDLQTQILQNQKVSQELLEKVEEAGGLEGIVQYSQTKRGKEKLQCGELVNDYWTKITGSRAGVGDTYESKVAAIQKAGQTEYPVEGGMFAYSTGEGNPGHVGIVTSVFPDGSIEVLEANREGSMDGTVPQIARYEGIDTTKMVFSDAPGGGKTSGDQIVGALGVPVTFERSVKNLVPATLMNSEIELKQLNDTIVAMHEAGLSDRDAALVYMGFNVEDEEQKQLANNLIDIGRSLPEDLAPQYVKSISDMINIGNTKAAVKKAENTVYTTAKELEGEDFVSEGKVKTAVERAKELSDLVSQLDATGENPIGVFEGKLEKWLGSFKSKNATEIANRATQLIAKMKTDLVGTQSTAGENKLLEPLIPDLGDQVQNFNTKLTRLREEPLRELNNIRTSYLLPELNENTLIGNEDRSQLYMGGFETESVVEGDYSTDDFNRFKENTARVNQDLYSE